MTLSLIVPATAAVFFALGVLFQRSLYAAAIYLLMALLQVAVVFYSLGAHLLAMTQALIYAGAIMVLIVVAIMASSDRVELKWAELRLPSWLIGVMLGLGFIEIFTLIQGADAQVGVLLAASTGLERKMAGILFGPYAPMTEIVAILLIVSALSVVQE